MLSTSRLVPALTVTAVAAFGAIAVLHGPAEAADRTPAPDDDTAVDRNDVEPGDDEPGGDDEPERVNFGIAAAGSEGVDPRSALTYGVAPGTVIFDNVAVINQSDQPLELLVYAADGVTAEGGGLDVRTRNQVNTDVGSWVSFDGRSGPVSVTVPAQSAESGRGEVLLPIQVSVPENATPGDHVGGIVASLVSLGESPESQNIELEQRSGTRLYFRVDGPLRPALDVEVLEVGYRAGPNLWDRGRVEVTYRVTNAGNTRLGVTTDVGVRGPFGIGARTSPGPEVVEIVPNGGSTTLNASVDDVPPLVRMTASVSVTAIPAPDAELFEVSASARDSFWAVHWQLLVLLGVALVVVAAVVVVVWRRRRSRRSSAPGDDGDNSRPDAAATAGPAPYATA